MLVEEIMLYMTVISISTEEDVIITQGAVSGIIYPFFVFIKYWYSYNDKMDFIRHTIKK